MEDRSEEGHRRPRADARRNRERLLRAAHQVFSAGGPEASLEAVARSAGVGIGTLYRHFPTREALFEAVYRHEVDELVELAERLSAEVEPAEALRRWLHAGVDMVATKKGMIVALALAADSAAELSADSRARLTACVGRLMERGVAAGQLRDELSPEAFMSAFVGLCSVHAEEPWQETVIRLIDIFVDGLRLPRDAKG